MDEARCGVGLRSQVAVFLGRTSAGGDRADAVGVGGKTCLRELTEDETGLSIEWAAGYVRPRGGNLDSKGVEVRAVVTHPAGPWLLHANLGWKRD